MKALSPSEVEETSQQCDSVVRTLLQVDDLQGDLASYLLEKLVLVSMEGSGDSRVTHESSQTPMSIPTLILSQLRYLNHVVDGAALADKMMEILQVKVEVNHTSRMHENNGNVHLLELLVLRVSLKVF